MAQDPAASMEQTFFNDPALDRVMGVVLNLSAELQVLRERVMVLEGALAERDLVPSAALAEFAAAPKAQAALGAERDAFANQLLEPLLGRAASASEAGDFYAR